MQANTEPIVQWHKRVFEAVRRLLLKFITIIIIHFPVAWSEPTHWLLCSHRLGAECFTTGVPDGVKDQWLEQILSEEGVGM